MIRQAHSYMAGAISGAVLIAAAVVIFILLLVSTQGFRDLPLVDTGADENALAPAQPVSQAVGSAGGQGSGSANRGSGGTGRSSSGDGGQVAAGGGQGTVTSPSAGGPGGGGEENRSPSSASDPGESTTGGAGSRPSSGGGGGGSGGGGGGSNSPSRTVTGAVNETVDGVDSALGGALGRTGVTDTTQGVVDGAAGSGSVVGQTVERGVDAVRDLLGGNR